MSGYINVRSELDKGVEVTVCERLLFVRESVVGITFGGSGGIACESSHKNPGDRSTARAAW